jgi:hypothetical protein
MIKKFRFTILVSTLFFIALTSCNKESTLLIQNDNQNSTNELKTLVNQVKIWHDSIVSIKITGGNSENNIKSFSLGPDDIIPPVIDWDKAFINYDSNNVKSMTIPLSMNYSNGEYLQLVATKYKNSTNGYLIKILPDSAYFSKQVDIYDYKNFNGSITIYNLKGIRLKKEIFKQGIVSKSVFNSKTSQSNHTNFDTEPPCDGCDLLTVVVYNSKRSSYSYGSYDYGLIYISNYQNIQVDGFGGGGGGGGVFAGGGDASADDVNYYYQFPLKSDYIKKYPKFTELVKNIYQNSLKKSQILNWLKTYSHMTDDQIKNAMQFNQGPTIIITDINDPNTYSGAYRIGKFNPKEPQNIYIDIKTVEDFENDVDFSYDAYSLFLYASILHETVHYGNYSNHFNEGIYEWGNGFEIAAFGSLIELKKKN